MKLTLKEKNNFSVLDCRNGKGVFTRHSFTEGEILFEIRGEIITCNVEDDLSEEIRNNAYPYDHIRYVSPQGTLGDFLNHSCEPNAKVVKEKSKLHIVALRDIPSETEVCFDYSTILAVDDIWTMKCNCGTKSCRGRVKRFATLPKKIQDAYTSKGMVPIYILS